MTNQGKREKKNTAKGNFICIHNTPLFPINSEKETRSTNDRHVNLNR